MALDQRLNQALETFCAVCPVAFIHSLLLAGNVFAVSVLAVSTRPFWCVMEWDCRECHSAPPPWVGVERWISNKKWMARSENFFPGFWHSSASLYLGFEAVHILLATRVQNGTTSWTHYCESDSFCSWKKVGFFSELNNNSFATCRRAGTQLFHVKCSGSAKSAGETICTHNIAWWFTTTIHNWSVKSVDR